MNSVFSLPGDVSCLTDSEKHKAFENQIKLQGA